MPWKLKGVYTIFRAHALLLHIPFCFAKMAAATTIGKSKQMDSRKTTLRKSAGVSLTAEDLINPNEDCNLPG